jgi:hypothetical protein
MTDTKPEALRLAQWLETSNNPHDRRGAVELRRLHEVNAELLEALKLAETFVGFGKELDQIHEAIAKATGDSA